MAAGTVGYTDTRGNKDYTSIIAKSIGNRLKQASNMASEERAYAAGMAEAGGTSLEEAGIGKGYFFGRALGSRFGGDRIARAKGRMGVGGAGTNPATNYKQRFRGGFDYNVTNNTITDVAPLSNALVVGLRGVQQGLSDVGGAIQRQGTVLNQLSQSQADMAKATMFNGYLFAMFQSQQRQAQGRESLRREERSIERGGFGRGRIGGSSFGGAGGGRGMINVTGGGSGGGAGGDGGGGGASFFTSNILSSGARLGSSSLSAGRGLNSAVSGSAKGYKALASGDIVGLMTKGGISQYDKLGISAAEVTGQVTKADSVALAAAKMFGFSPEQTKSLATMVNAGAKKGGGVNKYMDDAIAASLKYPTLYQETNAAGKRILQIQTLAEQFGRKPDAISEGMMNAVRNLSDYDATVAGARKAISKGIPTNQFDIYMSAHDDLFGAVAKKYGEKNARQFMKLGLFNAGDALIHGVDAVKDTSVIADKLMKHYPDMTYESLEKAVLMARVGDMAEAGMGSTKIIKEVRKQLGNNVADDLFLKYSDDILSNTQVMKQMAKGSSRIGLRRILKAVPGIGLGLGVIFGIQRAMEGDFLGAGLEIGSGVLGLNPATTGLGLGIDGFLLARDMGVVNMRERGRIIPSGANVPFNVGGQMFSMNENGQESLRVERDDKSRHLDAGIGFIEAMKSRKNDYVKILGSGVYSGIGDANNAGLFESIGGGISNMVEGIKEMFGNLKDGFTDTFNNLKESLVNKFNNFKDAVGNKINNVKQWWNKDSSDGSMIDNARFNVQKFINRRILGKKDAKYMKDYNPTEGVIYGQLPADYKETEAKYFQTGMYTPNVENDGINVVPGNITGHTVITNNYYGGGSDGGGVDTGDANPLVSDLDLGYVAANMSLASKT